MSMVLTSMYLGAKVFELRERFKLLKKAFINFLRNQVSKLNKPNLIRNN